MFENILGQDKVTSLLQGEIAAGSLPSSLLFSGPPASARLSTALELARVLCCEEGATWNCRCRSCELHRVLAHPSLLLAGARPFVQDIAAAGWSLCHDPRESTRYLFIRAIRKLTRRFDPVLWEHDATRVQKVAETARKLEDELADILPPRTLGDAAWLQKKTASCVQFARAIVDAIHLDTVSVGMVRQISQWTHMSAQTRVRVAIIEQADRMLEGARNALLKTLEEPPKDVFLILITSRKGLIIPTLLSRLRVYQFEERSLLQEQEVLRTIFRSPVAEGENLPDFFLAREGVNLEHVEKAAEAILHALVHPGNGPAFSALIPAADELVPELTALRLVLSRLLALFRQVLHGEMGLDGHAARPLEGSDLARMSRWTYLVHEALQRSEQYNIRPELALHRLYHDLRGI